MVNTTPRPLYPRERDPVLIAQEAGWAPGPAWTGAEHLAPTGVGIHQKLPIMLTVIVVLLQTHSSSVAYALWNVQIPNYFMEL